MTDADQPLVGLVGASGAVGAQAARALRGLGRTRLRLGGRRAAPLRALAAELGAGAEARPVDLDDAAALADFCSGCAVVVNCAGPSYRIVDRVARAALAAGADYVDVTGDAPVHARLSRDGLAGRRTAVLSAGVLPGLSALLPRWAARGRLERVVAYTGGLERCTEAAAADLLLSLPGSARQAAVFGEPLAVWRAGRRVPRALQARDGVRAPFFPEEAFVQPFLTGEAERLAAALGLREVQWHTVHPGPRTRAVLTGAAGRPDGADGATAARLRAAADLDLAGRTPYYLLVFQLTERVEGKVRERCLVVRTADSYRLSGRVAAVAAHEVLRGAVPPGLHYACDVLDPRTTVRLLFDDADAGTLHLLDGAAADGTAAGVEEGAL
ncbi:NAD-dependent dehydratase [Thermobifida alba]|uniref:NAD-dependent dehydratase n=1 Tax=Thermobifida alba TaxID=53522 RepID=A0ABY4KZ74_THEAE|nr:saccharopine dehydrogenase NADP-binding domain-containing protein [Thermobifida alba]UPT20350.1 NAD-dependent dehydratase [Thermobifida alba]